MVAAVAVGSAASVGAIYATAELGLIRIITRMLAAGIDLPGWAVARLGQVNALRRSVGVVMAALNMSGLRATRRAVIGGYRAGARAARNDLTHAAGPTVTSAGVLRDAAERALADAAVAELRPVHEAILPAAINAYRSVVADAAARVLSTGIDQREAGQQAWQQLVDRGVVGFTDQAGKRWRLHSWVEMAVRTAVARAVVQGIVDTFTDAGQRLVRIPDTLTSCDICRPWLGKVVALWGATGHVLERDWRTGTRVGVFVAATLDEARAAGLFHPNCRHSPVLWRPGESRPAPTRTTPAAYAAEQRQRYLERGLRRWRERHAAALTPQAAANAERKVRGWQRELVHHLNQHPDLPRLVHREQPGAGWAPPTATLPVH